MRRKYINSNCQNIYDTIYLKEFKFSNLIYDVFPDSLKSNQ